MPETVAAAIAAFVGTNLDDIFINTLFFAQADTPAKVRAAYGGKFLGMGALMLAGILGAAVLQALPAPLLRALGLVPVTLGVRQWLDARREAAEPDPTGDSAPDLARGFALSMAAVTVANGADNLGVYLPLFAGYAPAQLAVTAAVFAAMTALWCRLGQKLADWPGLRTALLRHKGSLVPAVYIALGAYILLKP